MSSGNTTSDRADRPTRRRPPWRPFDEQAASYDRWYETPLGAFADRVEREAVFGLLEPMPGERILDVGCGTGRYVLALADRGANPVGIEPSAGMLAFAIARCAAYSSPAFARGVAESLPFTSGVFDAAISVTTLEFVGDLDAALAEAARVTKSGGRLVLGVLNARGPWAARRRRSQDAVWKSARFFSRAEIEERLRAFGEVRFRLAVYPPPQLSGAPQPVLSMVERLGARLAPSLGAFIAVRVDLRR
jgi:ubiquinone/menaquinone biosynthesis C-methylase UbiE